MTAPFRWNVAKREQIGRLLITKPILPYPEFLADLHRCCSRILAFCDNADLVFVGRSPESIFDYLSGLLGDTSWAERCNLLHFSMRIARAGQKKMTLNQVSQQFPGAIAAMREQLGALGLEPTQIAARSRPVAFIDLVASGQTLGNLTELLVTWARESQANLPVLKKKLRFIGITRRQKTSPNTRRWQQDSEWVRQFPLRSIKNVSIPLRLWGYLGDAQEKLEPSYPPWRWGDEALLKPPRNVEALDALSLAVALYEAGCSKPMRLEFAGRLAQEPAMKEAWFRSLILELKGVSDGNR